MSNEKPIRILHYIGSLNIGGSQTMIMELYRKIDKSKIQFDFVVDRKGEMFFSDEIKKLGGKIYELKYFKGTNFLEFRKQWNDFFIKHSEYKIIHCHVRSVASIVLKIAKKHALKTICHSHSTSNGSGIKSVVKKVLQSNITKYSDYLFACSIDSGKWLYGDKAIQQENFFVINNAIDSSKYIYNEELRKKIRNKYKLNNKIVIGQVGRLETVKNHLFSLEILKQCLKKNKNYVLLIVGDGSLRSTIQKKSKEIGVDKNVIMLGNRSDVNELMQAMDVFLMPSLWEGLPLSLIEAQAASLPCVISTAICDGILDCNLVKKNDLCDNFNKWCDSINLFSQYIRKNNSKVIISNKFDIKKNVEWLEKIYDEMGNK